MGILLSVFYLALFLLAGWLLARCALPEAAPTVTLPLGCGFGVALLAALPALFALVLRFALPAVLCAGGCALLLILALWLWLRKAFALTDTAPGQSAAPGEVARGFWMAGCLVPLGLLTAVLLYTHILRVQDGAYYTGQSCYGDMAMHLTFIKSLAVRGDFPPVYPLLGGQHTFGYPFLCESVSSVFLLLGADLRTAYLLPMLPALFSVYGMGWNLAARVLRSAKKACLAFWLFFMGSGFGFVYFLQSKEKFFSIFTAFYNTPTNYTEKNILWVNPVVDLLLPQRATLFGWAVLFPALYLLWRFAQEEQARLWKWLALLVLPLPLLHTHSALALVVISVVCGCRYLPRLGRAGLRRSLLPWAGYAGLCGCVWLSIMWGTVLAQSVNGQHMLRLGFNWANGSNGILTDPYFWFYIKNIGLVYLLLIPAFVHADKLQRWFYAGGLGILILAECVIFQVNPYDNNKLLYVWHLLGCILVAQLLWDWLAKLRSFPARCLLTFLLVFIATFGSVLTAGRELVSNYCQWTADDIALAAQVDANAAPDSLFLTSDSHLEPVACLAGRQILCGSGSFVYFHGMDYSDEYGAMEALYQTPTTQLLDAWGIDYALFDSSVFGKWPGADEGWYAARYPLWYQNASCRVYRITG